MLSRRSLRLPVVAAFAVVSLLTAGCGDSSKDADAKPAGDSGPTTTYDIPKDDIVDETGKAVVEIIAVDNSLEPRYVEVSPGTRIVWKNEGRNPHDILPANEGAFAAAKAAEMPPGASHTVTLDEPGDYPYYCSTHGTMKNGMNGAIRVVAE